MLCGAIFLYVTGSLSHIPSAFVTLRSDEETAAFANWCLFWYPRYFLKTEDASTQLATFTLSVRSYRFDLLKGSAWEYI